MCQTREQNVISQIHSFRFFATSVNLGGMSPDSANPLPIVIEEDVWVGANCVILAGAKVGKGSIVAAGAVVTNGEIPPYSIVGGVPAKIIGFRGKSKDNSEETK
ncbi:MAG: hypothetical protein HZB31_14550 [Nitrospirae bacterium]|nr:hypothetical protein [Nitrospirota bacterium]